ncbi:MAG TPA: SLBB domain-containing protein [Candidatus Limnocylindria bacterium]|nr:SLBB domain-containing protein [Candidatus Limnocylindria bacterium]
MSRIRDHRLPRLGRIGLTLALLLCALPCVTQAQERTGYIVGEPQGLEMMVHIIGEVQKPGEYRVGDRTDILELLSKAGGPTQFSRLSSVTVRRLVFTRPSASLTTEPPRAEILQVNLDKALRNRDEMPIRLQPGDVVVVPKNGWRAWKDATAVIRDVSVVASAYFLYLRASK